jgi:serine/threonine-protein kinase
VKLWQQLARRYEEIEEFALAADVLAEAQSETPEHVEIIEQMRAVNQHLAHLRAEDPEWRQILGELSVGARTRYDMRERIGQGAVGEVFLAYDKELDELVVLKLLGHEYDGDAEVQQRFRLEAKAARRLSHPNIVRIHDLGEEGGRKHISMEYVPGGDLRTFFRAHDRRLPNDFVVDIVRQVARALVHAHSEGILHRDIKPGNILMATRGRVKLSDFGIAAITAGRYEEEKTAKERDPFASSTGGAVAGSPLYMAPEQFVETEPLSEASDVYSLGVMFFELLAGEPPFTRGSIAYHHQFTPPPALPPSVPALLREVVAKCLQKKPADRYQNAVDLLNALDGWDGNRHQRKAAGDINSLVTPEEWSFEDLPAGG